MAKDFWRDCTDAYNDFDDEDNNPAFKMVVDINNEHYEDLICADLHDAELMTADVMRKKITELFRIRRQVQKNMTQSGTHESDPFDFMQVATHSLAISGTPPLASYYFFLRCDENPEIDIAHQDSLDPEMEGSTVSSLEAAAPKSNEKKRAYAAIYDISTTTKRIADGIEQQNSIAQVTQKIEIARALGDKEALRHLLEQLTDQQTLN